MASLNSQLVALAAWKREVADTMGAFNSRVDAVGAALKSQQASLSERRESTTRIEERVGAAERATEARLAKVYADTNAKYQNIMDYLQAHLPPQPSLSQTQLESHDG